MNAEAFPAPALRPFLPADGPLLVQIFRDSIAELTARIMTRRSSRPGSRCADDETAFASGSPCA